MSKIKNDISLIFGVITVAIIMIILVGVINNKGNNDFNFPSSNPKNINFPKEQPESNTGDLLPITTENNSSGTQLNNDSKKNEINQDIIKQIELANTINISGITGDGDLCNNIENTQKKQECLNNSYASLASSKNDLTYCKKNNGYCMDD